MKNKIFILVGMVLFLLNINVYAAGTCESSELTRLRKLAEKVEFTYDYEVKEIKTPGGNVNKYLDYSITAVNLNPDLQVAVMEDYYSNKFIEFKGDSEGKATLRNFIEGDKVEIKIYAYVENACSGKKITTKTIKLPYYNKYHDSEICHAARDYDYCLEKYYKEYCDEMQNFKYCQEMIDEAVSEEKFNSKIKEFSNGKVPHYHHYKYIESNNNWKYVIIGVVVLLIVLCFIIIKRKKSQKKKLKIKR